MSNTRTMTRRTYMPKSEALASPSSIAPCSVLNSLWMAFVVLVHIYTIM